MDAIRDRIKEFRRVPASSLRGHPKNWRKHSDAQREAMSVVLQEIGFAGAVLTRETPAGLEIIDGHLRADLSDEQTVPVLVLDVDEQEAAALLATFDPIGAMAEPDLDMFESLLDDVDGGNDALMELVGSIGEELGIEDDELAPEIIEDEAPEPPADPITKPGDVWLLGEHRLMCGDSTKAEDVARLMNGERADLCFTSPPYGAGNVAKLRDHYVRGAKKRESFYDQHDDNPESWPALMNGWFQQFRAVCDCVICNVQMLADNKRFLLDWLHDQRDDLVDVVVWDKINAAPQMQSNVLTNLFEFCFVFGGNGSRSIPFSEFHGTVGNIVRIDARGKNENADKHRAVMPLALPAWIMQTLCPLARTIAEPFSGSGTTIIAAEQLHRRCYAMEISPAYCDVAVARWEKLTGRKAQRVER